MNSTGVFRLNFPILAPLAEQAAKLHYECSNFFHARPRWYGIPIGIRVKKCRRIEMLFFMRSSGLESEREWRQFVPNCGFPSQSVFGLLA